MTTTTMPPPEPTLAMLLRVLKLPTIGRYADDVATKAEREGWSFAQYLRHLTILEVEERRRRRIERNQRDSNLLAEKTLATLNRKRLPAPVAKRVPSLCEGAFVERGDNILRPRAELHLHPAKGFCSNAIQRATPAGVNRGDGVPLGVGEKNGDAIRSLDDQQDARLTCDQGVALSGLFHQGTR